jgi:two-component system sensor histidine kinase DegS
MIEERIIGGEITLQEFLEKAYLEAEQTKRELNEIEILIRQSAAEVERLAQRNAQATSYVRQLQTQLEMTPREDIREGYDALIIAQQRLFTMRGQLEKLQSDQRNLERLASFQQSLLDVTSGMVTLPEAQPRQPQTRTDIVRIIQAEETARKGLVRKMHDGPASSISNFILQAEICQRFFDLNQDRARSELNGLKGSATTTFETVREFIFDLRPMMLDDLGLVPTLRRYVETLQEKYDLPVSMNVTGIERRLEDYIEVTIFRTVQELLLNARTHAQATQYQVLVDLSPDHVTVVVEDNGSGFRVEDVYSNTDKISLTTLRERIEMLDGELKIESTLGVGTRAEIVIPVENVV